MVHHARLSCNQPCQLCNNKRTCRRPASPCSSPPFYAAFIGTDPDMVSAGRCGLGPLQLPTFRGLGYTAAAILSPRRPGGARVAAACRARPRCVHCRCATTLTCEKVGSACCQVRATAPESVMRLGPAPMMVKAMDCQARDRTELSPGPGGECDCGRPVRSRGIYLHTHTHIYIALLKKNA